MSHGRCKGSSLTLTIALLAMAWGPLLVQCFGSNCHLDHSKNLMSDIISSHLNSYSHSSLSRSALSGIEPPFYTCLDKLNHSNCKLNLRFLPSIPSPLLTHASIQENSNIVSNLKIAFSGDLGIGDSSVKVIQKIKQWNPHLFLQLGDFDYVDNPESYFKLYDTQFPNAPLLAAGTIFLLNRLIIVN